MNSNLKYTIGIILMVGSLLVIGTNVFANHSEFRADLTKTEKIALAQEEDRAIRTHEVVNKKYSEDFVTMDTSHEKCYTTSFRANLPIDQQIALMKSEERDLSNYKLANLENSVRVSNLAKQEESCGFGSVRKGLNEIERTFLEREEHGQ